MKRRVIVMMGVVLVSAVLCACASDKGSDETAQQTEENTIEEVVEATPEKVETQEQSSESITEQAEETEPEASMVNPMVEYATYPELEEQIDFDYLFIPESDGYHCTKIFLIGGETVDLRFDSKDIEGAEACVRTAKGTEDINGYYGAEYEEVKIGEVTVNKGCYKGETADEYMDLAWWTDGTYSYGVSFSRLDPETFDSLLESAVGLSTRINQ